MRKIVLSFFIHIILFAQAQSPVTDAYLKSPNMASLGEYGEIPVSLYTGSVQVDIPMYTLVSGNHSINMSLSYHGGGVRPDTHPGWVGMGWTLFAGGSITRVIGGLPDECDKILTLSLNQTLQI